LTQNGRDDSGHAEVGDEVDSILKRQLAKTIKSDKVAQQFAEANEENC
jgi:hypothetical protein